MNTDRNIAIVASSGVDVFITNDHDLITGMRIPLPNLIVLNWDAFANCIKVETTRLKYRPKKITTLFVGESAPKGGDFFYYGRSQLYRRIREAIEAAGFGGSDDFLDHFRALGWYLDDLVLVPVNKLSSKVRETVCLNAQPYLAKRIEEYQPQAVVSLLWSKRSPHVKQRVWDATKEGSKSARCYAVHFPGRWDQRRFLDDMKCIISELPRVPACP
jgi:hypothetical protein